MEYLAAAAGMVAIAIGCGFWAGGAKDRTKLRKHFIYGASIVTVMAGLFAALVWSTFAEIKATLILYLRDVSADINPQSVTSAMMLATAFVVILFAMFAGLIAFNCRRSVSRWYIALGATAISGPVLGFLFVFGFYGLAVFWVLFQPSCYLFPAFPAFWAVLILTAVLCVIWTLHSFWGKRHSWKTLLSALGIGAGAYCGVWLLALAVAYPYACYVKNKALRQNVVPIRQENSLPPESEKFRDITASFHEKHQLFELPVDSVYDWTPNAGSLAEIVPAAQREETLKIFDTPEARDYYNAARQLMQYGSRNDILYWPALNCIRAHARICAGRAALYRETNQPDKILPMLMEMTQIDDEILKDRPFIISELVRIACRPTWYTYLVKLGPDDAQYAPVYREALNFMKNRRIHLPVEAGYYLGMYNEIKTGSCGEILELPSTLALMAKYLSFSLSAGPEVEKLSQMEVFGDCSPSLDYPNYKLIAQKSRISIVMGTTALALKLYRAEHGQYPDSLDQLIPDYLEKLPVSPVSGKPLAYQSDGKGFRLDIPEFPHNQYGIDSAIEY